MATLFGVWAAVSDEKLCSVEELLLLECWRLWRKRAATVAAARNLRMRRKDKKKREHNVGVSMNDLALAKCHFDPLLSRGSFFFLLTIFLQHGGDLLGCTSSCSSHLHLKKKTEILFLMLLLLQSFAPHDVTVYLANITNCGDGCKHRALTPVKCFFVRIIQVIWKQPNERLSKPRH